MKAIKSIVINSIIIVAILLPARKNSNVKVLLPTPNGSKVLGRNPTTS